MLGEGGAGTEGPSPRVPLSLTTCLPSPISAVGNQRRWRAGGCGGSSHWEDCGETEPRRESKFLSSGSRSGAQPRVVRPTLSPPPTRRRPGGARPLRRPRALEGAGRGVPEGRAGPGPEARRGPRPARKAGGEAGPGGAGLGSLLGRGGRGRRGRAAVMGGGCTPRGLLQWESRHWERSLTGPPPGTVSRCTSSSRAGGGAEGGAGVPAARWPARGPALLCHRTMLQCPILLPQNSNPSSSTISPVFLVFSKVGLSPACCTRVEPAFLEPPIHCGQPCLAPPPPRLPLIYFCLSLRSLSVPPPGTISRCFSQCTQQVHPKPDRAYPSRDYNWQKCANLPFVCFFLLPFLFVHSGNLSWLLSLYVDIYICVCASYHSISCLGHSSCLIPL